MKKNLLKMTNPQLKKYLYKFLKKYYKEIIRNDLFLIAKGDIPIALVAHVDTVWETPPKQIYYSKKKSILWSPQGLGADDRAGVSAILQLIEEGYRPTIIFCDEEETGAIGASSLVNTFPKIPWKINFLIELDRRGSEDSIFYNYKDIEFENYINSFGFITAKGIFSDIYVIGPRWNIPSVNLSIGYYNEHTTKEYLSLIEMQKTIEKVKNILEAKEIEFKNGYYKTFTLF